MTEPKSPLTSARMFDKQDNEHLAQWLDNDADAMDGQPGRNNHVAAVRAAAERLRSDALAQVKAERDAHAAGKQDLALALGTVTAQRDDANAGYMAVVQRLEESAAENAALRQVIEEARGALALDARSSVRVAAAAGILAGEGEQSALTGSSVSSSDEVTESEDAEKGDVP